ncbi:MAG TPA: hypothetical protein VMV81_07290 [Phycisphaerae bacterium]|nr:hypothetical protein [Phycisphaerae bacterium]
MPGHRARLLDWNLTGRLVSFILAATSIACLLSEMYGLCPMRPFTLWIFGPSCLLLIVLGCVDALAGSKRLARMLVLGAAAGFVAAIAYDVFRLPFVYSRSWGLAGFLPPLNLFKVFPRFGAMILAQPVEQEQYSLATRLIGWAYHFSNGATFGIMYLAMIGRTTRSIGWAILFAAGLEAAMLLTPYPQVFGIALTTAFVLATLTAHMVFGAALGFSLRAAGRRIHN